MPKLPLLLLPLLFLANICLAQSSCACCTAQHRQFDFWLGDWLVYDTTGAKVGENLIEKVEADCVVSERWQSATGTTGRSYNYFDAADSTWNQVWIDSQGQNLVLKGKASPDKMVLQSALTTGRQGIPYANRITWTRNSDGTVTQLWEILDPQGTPVHVAFKGIYKRRR
ncbi:hypothetical protein MKJ04_12200 [Pontibacter sp. E15-1]|uniref:hypothetical protein n=1 Tax=Pontibacter sp. E15-1 TaxID=2919918 RepID=UPI001F503385|nr:hypothetical protein [Pontibacter sp. E15-1]MCJ8165604.1 hypothetical protein [Pontibacter sp. E15-1]